MKAWKQLIALNLVLVLLLSLFPGVAFAEESGAEQTAAVSDQIDEEQPQEPEVVVDETPAVTDVTEITLTDGESFTFRKTSENYFPLITIQIQNGGYYRLQITPPEHLSDVTIDGSYSHFTDTDMYLEIFYTMISPFPNVEAKHDFIYKFYEKDAPGFRLRTSDGHQVADSGDWIFSVDYIEPEPLEFGVPLGASDTECFHVYSTEMDQPAYCQVTAQDPSSFTCSNGRSGWAEYTYQYMTAFQGSAEFFRVEEGTLLLACSLTPGGSGIVIEKGNPHGDFGAEGNNLHWVYEPGHEKLTISGTGAMGGATGEAFPWDNYRYYLKEIVVEPGVTEIASEAFNGFYELEKLSLPEGLTSIGSRAFVYCDDLMEVRFPSTLTEIGDSAFEYAGVTRFDIPAGLTSLGVNALHTRGLSAVEVDDANPVYSASDGVLYSRDGSKLLLFPAAKCGPFCVPETVTSIEQGAFSDCFALSSLYLPASLEFLGQSDFMPSLVHFGGTAEQWAELSTEGFQVNEGHVLFGCSASDYLGQNWQYELEDVNLHPVLSFTPEDTGIYKLSAVAPSGLNCLMSYSSPGSMTIYVSQNGTQQQMLDGTRKAFFGGQDYELQLQPGCGTYDDGYYEVTELGTFTIAAQKLAMQNLELGETVIAHAYDQTDYYMFTAPETGYYTIRAEGPADNPYVNVPIISNTPYTRVDDFTRGVRLLAGQSVLMEIRYYIDQVQFTIESLGSTLRGECGEHVSWSLDSEGLLTISGVGDMTDYSTFDDNPPWNIFRDMISEIRVEEGVTSIGNVAFAGICPSAGVSLPSTLRRIGEYAFLNCYDITELSLPDGLQEIADYAFLDCADLTSVTIPDGVRSIGAGAFNECCKLQRFRIPAELESFGNGALGYTPECVIELPEANQHFVMVDGILYDRDMTTVYYSDHTLTGTIRLPDSVREICDYALAYSGIEKLIIPEGVQNIHDSMCLYCRSLTEIHFPSTITVPFHTDVVYLCNSLQDVYYNGSAVQWYQLTDDFSEGTQTTITYHFTKTSEAEAAGAGSHSVMLTEQNPAAAYCFTAPAKGLYQINANDAKICVFLEDGAPPNSISAVLGSDDANYVKLNAGDKLYVIVKLRPYSESDSVEVQWSIDTVDSVGADVGWHIIGDAANTILYRFVPSADGEYMFEAFPDMSSFRLCVFDEDLHFVKNYSNCSYVNQTFNFEAGKPVYLLFSLFSGTFADNQIHWSLNRPNSPIRLIEQPQSQSIELNQYVTFSVWAQGDDLSYQWYYRKPGKTFWYASTSEDAQTQYLTVQATQNRDGQSYRCEVRDASGNKVTSDAATLTVIEPASKVEIMSHPESVSVELNGSAVFSVWAEGEGLTYQWFYRPSGAEDWYPSSSDGAQTDTLTVQATQKRNGQAYFCVVRDMYGKTATSNEAVLTVLEPPAAPEISNQPENASANLNEMVTFSVAADGTGLTYQWYYRPAGSTAWYVSYAEGAQSPALAVKVLQKRDGQAYRCVVTDAYGRTVTSEEAVLTVLEHANLLQIVSQPMDQNAALNTNAVFAVSAEGDGLTYRWQFCQPGKDTWSNSSMDGANTDTLVVPVTAKRDGQRYRCVITDANGEQVISDPATLTVASTVLEILSQPQDASAAVGETVFFIVSAQGDGLTYQWQYCQPGKDTWSKSSMDGANTDTLAVPVTAKRDGQRYRCVITDASGKRVISDTAMLTIAAPGDPITILSQPQDVSAAVGETVSFSVSAEGDGLTYQWQYRQAGKTTWSKSGMSGAATDTLVVPVTAKRNGQSYRCVITDAAGNQLITKSATLHIG